MELLNSSHSLLHLPKTPVTSPCPKKKGEPFAKELPKERPAIKESPDSPPDDVYPKERGQMKAGGAARSNRRSSPAQSPRKEEGPRAEESFKRKAQEQHEAFTSSSSIRREEDAKKRTKRESSIHE